MKKAQDKREEQHFEAERIKERLLRDLGRLNTLDEAQRLVSGPAPQQTHPGYRYFNQLGALLHGHPIEADPDVAAAYAAFRERTRSVK